MSPEPVARSDRKSTRLNSSHTLISYAVFCLKKKQKEGTAGRKRRRGGGGARRHGEALCCVTPPLQLRLRVASRLLLELSFVLFFFFRQRGPTVFPPFPPPAPLPA